MRTTLRLASSLGILAPLLTGLAAVLAWELIIDHWHIATYVLPAPSAIWQAFVTDWRTLLGAAVVTLRVALFALLCAVIIGFSLAVFFSEWRQLERALLPYVIIFQVTPTVAVAPLIIIWFNNATAALIVCATFVAVFSILSATLTGLKSADHRLLDLFQIQHASRWQTLVLLKIPAALPHFLSGLRIAAGLALIGAVVAEFVAGTGGRTAGLAYQILDAGYQLQFARLFAALALITLTGIALQVGVAELGRLCLRRWHYSTRERNS